MNVYFSIYGNGASGPLFKRGPMGGCPGGQSARACTHKPTAKCGVGCAAQRPLLGVKRTWRGLVSMSANDPKRTSFIGAAQRVSPSLRRRNLLENIQNAAALRAVDVEGPCRRDAVGRTHTG